MVESKPGRLGIGLVGSGFMGRAHAFAFGSVAQVFDLPLRPELAVLADWSEEVAAKAAERLGFARSVGDWRALVDDPAVDVVAITAPNTLHKPIALAALAAGKHVYCEKPLAPTLSDSREMAEAARGVRARDDGRLPVPAEPDARGSPARSSNPARSASRSPSAASTPRTT